VPTAAAGRRSSKSTNYPDGARGLPSANRRRRSDRGAAKCKLGVTNVALRGILDDVYSFLSMFGRDRANVVANSWSGELHDNLQRSVQPPVFDQSDGSALPGWALHILAAPSGESGRNNEDLFMWCKWVCGSRTTDPNQGPSPPDGIHAHNFSPAPLAQSSRGVAGRAAATRSVVGVVASAGESLVASSAGAVLRAAATMLGALGAVHTLTGATTLSPSTPSPAAATVGTAKTLAFTVAGTQSPASCVDDWR